MHGQQNINNNKIFWCVRIPGIYLLT